MIIIDSKTGRQLTTVVDLKNSITLSNDADLSQWQGRLSDIELITLSFPSFSDGRAFSQAARLRSMGYLGIIRVEGMLIPDQCLLAERCGIEQIAISTEYWKRTTPQAWQRAMGVKPQVQYRQKLTSLLNAKLA